MRTPGQAPDALAPKHIITARLHLSSSSMTASATSLPAAAPAAPAASTSFRLLSTGSTIRCSASLHHTTPPPRAGSGTPPEPATSCGTYADPKHAPWRCGGERRPMKPHAYLARSRGSVDTTEHSPSSTCTSSRNLICLLALPSDTHGHGASLAGRAGLGGAPMVWSWR
jgi:hypothetical protein